MTATFPPKPWNEGDTFANDTTNVTYVFNGKAWVSAGTPGDPQVDCLPVNNPRATGALTVLPTEWQDQSKFCVTNGSNSYFILKPSTTNERSQVQYFGLTEGDFDVATVGYVKSQLTSLGEEQEQVPSTCRKFKYAGDRSWGNMRPGEFQLLDKDRNITNELDKCSAIIFKGEDADGNRAVRDENRISYQSFGGSALNILNSDLTRLYFRAPVGLLEYGEDIDCYSLWWSDRDAGARRTSTFVKFTNSQTVYLQCADMFF